MINDVGYVFGMLEELIQLGDVLPGFAQVEGAEILVEGLVLEILRELTIYVVNIEVEGFGHIFRRLRI